MIILFSMLAYVPIGVLSLEPALLLGFEATQLEIMIILMPEEKHPLTKKSSNLGFYNGMCLTPIN